jgi:hypothetical protein
MRYASRRTALALLTLLAVASGVHGKGDPQQSGEVEKNDPIPLCEVLASPERYRDQEVAVRATYRVGYEASELYCLSCSQGGHVWVEFDSADGGDKAAKAVSRLMHHKNGTVNGVFAGVFHSNGSYGHLGAYQHELLVGSVSDLKVVDRLGLPPSRLSAYSHKKVCQ